MIQLQATLLSVRDGRAHCERVGRIFSLPLTKGELEALTAGGQSELVVTIAVADVAAKEGVVG